MSEVTSSVFDDSVTENEDGKFDFKCPVTDGSCGTGGVGFQSTGWDTRELAMARGEQHFHDHMGTPMPELETFRQDQGVSVSVAAPGVDAATFTEGELLTEMGVEKIVPPEEPAPEEPPATEEGTV